MRAVVDVARLVGELVRYGVASRRILFPAVVVAGLLLAAVVAFVKVVAPVVIYPLL